MSSDQSCISPARLSNQAIEGMDEAARGLMKTAVARKIEELLDVLRIDHRNDHNTRETPQRVAAMFVDEILVGRYTAPPTITEFENSMHYDQLIITGPIDVRSMCAHHMMPIYGEAYIGVLPSANAKIIGLSKYYRIVSYLSERLQIQEELVSQIGQYILDLTNPRGVAVRISAVHMCKTHRGVRSTRRSRMVNTRYFGEMRENAALQQEFLAECIALNQESACL